MFFLLLLLFAFSAGPKHDTTIQKNPPLLPFSFPRRRRSIQSACKLIIVIFLMFPPFFGNILEVRRGKKERRIRYFFPVDPFSSGGGGRDFFSDHQRSQMPPPPPRGLSTSIIIILECLAVLGRGRNWFLAAADQTVSGKKEKEFLGSPLRDSRRLGTAQIIGIGGGGRGEATTANSRKRTPKLRQIQFLFSSPDDR